MTFTEAQQKRFALYFSICGLLLMTAAVGAVSARDPSGVSPRVGMVLLTAAAALSLPWGAVLPAALAIWLGPNAARAYLDDTAFGGLNMLLELPGLLGVALFSLLARRSLSQLESEVLLGALNDGTGIDPETGLYEERMLRPMLENELVRSRRFHREFAFVLAGVDPMRQKFDYRNEALWHQGFLTTAQLLHTTRAYDRVFRWQKHGFAILLPEAGQREVVGLVRRLRAAARRWSPREGEPGGPLPLQFGATFFPHCATTPDDLLRRAEVALRIADKNSDRLQLDSAEAPELPPPETLRQGATGQVAAAGAALASAAEAKAGGTVLQDLHLPEVLAQLDETLRLIRSLRNETSEEGLPTPAGPG